MQDSPTPLASDIWNGKYVTYRRLWLDFYLNRFSSMMSGVVIDLGGKRVKKRGHFMAQENQNNTWWYINIAWDTMPNIFGDAMAVPCKSDSCDCIVCTEVLEHLLEPKKCVEEMHRILKPGGVAFVSSPFLFPIHADPYDFQRYTEDGLRHLFSAFNIVEVFPMGAYWGTLGMLLEIGLPAISGPRLTRGILRRALQWFSRLLYAHDINTFAQRPIAWKKYTTGYFLKVTK